MNKKIDLESTSSDHKGVKGLFEILLRRFKIGMHVLTMIPIYLFACSVIGLCLVPGIYCFQMISEWSANSTTVIKIFCSGFALALGYCLYGFSLLFVAPAVNFMLRAYLKPWRGAYHSAEALKWFMHNGLTYLARFTFLEFVTPSPLNLLFYRMMGMKMGSSVTINTTWISDPSLIEIGNKVTLGGSVTVVAHYGQGGLLIIAPVKIGDNCTIGLKAVIMGGVVIGNDAKVLPMSVVLPKTIIPDGETWGGVPACKIEMTKPATSTKAS